MISRKTLLLDLLKLSKEKEEIALDELLLRSHFSLQNLQKCLRRMNENFGGILKLDTDFVHIPKPAKMMLVREAIELGISLDQIIETLHWREFENFCLMVLDHHDFSTVQNFHFTLIKKRWEIDVIGMKDQLIFAIDAKKWKTGHAGALKTMVKNQINRVKDFSKAITRRKYRQKLNLYNWKKARVIPMLVTSKMYEIKIFKYMPIVPFFKLNEFLTDFHRYSELVLHFPVDFSSQKTLVSKKLTGFRRTS